MKNRILSLGMVALTMAASSAAYADGHVSVVIDPFGWGAPPPVVYAPPRYNAPPAVYYGRGRYGGHRDSHERYDRRRPEQHDRDNDRRR